MESSLISVIIPVYKVEEYIDQCLKSVVNQTYSNLEILLVDDGSPDNCPAICDRWAEKDSRIRVIHKENGGLSDARNVATLQAKGEYIAFIDSDDAVHRKYIEWMYAAIKEASADIATCNHVGFLKEIPEDRDDPKASVITYERLDALEVMLYQRQFDTSAHSKLFSAAIAKEYLYPKGRLYEDLFTTYKMIFSSQRVIYLNCGLYYYRDNPNGIMNQKFTNRMFDEIDAANQLLDFVENQCPQILSAALSRKFSAYSQVLRWTQNAPDTTEIREKQKLIWTFLTEYRWKMITDRKARRKNRLGAMLSFLGMNNFINFKI